MVDCGEFEGTSTCSAHMAGRGPFRAKILSFLNIIYVVFCRHACLPSCRHSHLLGDLQHLGANSPNRLLIIASLCMVHESRASAHTRLLRYTRPHTPLLAHAHAHVLITIGILQSFASSPSACRPCLALSRLSLCRPRRRHVEPPRQPAVAMAGRLGGCVRPEAGWGGCHSR